MSRQTGLVEGLLRTNKDCIYTVVITEVYNVQSGYPCGHKETDLIKVGSGQQLVPKIPSYNATVSIKVNNLFTPSFPTDSFFVSLKFPEYQAPYDEKPHGEWAVFASYFLNTTSNQRTHFFDNLKTGAAKHHLHVFRRKMGVVTEQNEEVRIYPNEKKSIEINW